MKGYENTNKPFNGMGNETQAESLPTGWRWIEGPDGKGCLLNPRNESYFNYDQLPYAKSNGIVYQVREGSDSQIFRGNLNEYKGFVEETVNEILTISGVTPSEDEQSFEMQQ